MGSTKIINVLSDDKFEELLDIVKETDASEVIFVMPKKTKAFKTEEQFAILDLEIQKAGKSVAFLCSNPNVNELARKYDFDVLSTKKSKPKSTPHLPSEALAKEGPQKPVVVPIVAKKDDTSDDLEDEIEDETEETIDKEPLDNTRDDPDENTEDAQEDSATEEDPAEETEEEVEEDYKEEESQPEELKDKPPYGTKVDDDGNIVYEEEREGGQISSDNSGDEFQIITASTKTRGMGDVIRPSSGKNLKISQKDKRSIKINTRSEEDDIQSVWGTKQTKNIWSDVPRPSVDRGSFLDKFNLFNRSHKPKRGLEFNSKHSKKSISILLFISVIILGSIIYITTGSAKIDIKPRAEKLNLQLKVSISPNFSSVDNSFNRIPGQLFTVNKSAVGEFNATAEKDAVQKSRGTITVYNEYSTSSQPLVATTRFEFLQAGKESGFVFKTLQTISVPGMTVENGVVTPGQIDVEVIATKAGQAYNVSAGDFGIVAWRERGDTDRYDKIYGKSVDSMHGGILGKAKVVSEFDYNNAKDQLLAKVMNDIEESLESQSAGLELLASIDPSIDSVSSTAATDDAADMFTMTVEGSIVTIGFKKDDLITLISQRVDKANGLVIVPDKLELSYKDIVINSTNNVFEVTVNIDGNAYAKIDKESITNNLMGKNEAQIKEYMGSVQDIDSAKVILSPFWVKKIPKNKSRIEVILSF